MPKKFNDVLRRCAYPYHTIFSAVRQALAALQAKENRLLLKEQAVLVTRTRIELVLQP